MAKDNKTPMFSMRLSTSLITMLDAIAEAENMSRSRVIRALLYRQIRQLYPNLFTVLASEEDNENQKYEIKASQHGN